MSEPRTNNGLRTWSALDFDGVDIHPGAIIEAEEAIVGPGAEIQADVRIAARRVVIGSGSKVEHGTRIRALTGTMDAFELGDQSLVGFASQILSPDVSIGDYCQLHNTGLHSGYRSLTMGHNCWVGQSSILNCTERLTIGNNVRIGTGSQLWTHVASGELLEGCTLYGETPLTLEDNVWIVGGAVISPGLTLRRNSIVMTGSVLTKSTEPFHTYAGVPARDVTDKLSFWRRQSLEEKLARIRGFVEEFVDQFPEHRDHIIVSDSHDRLDQLAPGDIMIMPTADGWDAARERRVSLFDLTSKTYLKQRSPLEVQWIRWTVGYRARFLPREN